MTASNIEWTDDTWNPVRGCSRYSPGCLNCYAERQAVRQSGPGGKYEGLVRSTPSGPRWTGKVAFDEKKLVEPLSWRKPRRVFVNSMSDLFHEALTDEQIDRVFAVMALADQHTFQCLTKRPQRMRDYLREIQDDLKDTHHWAALASEITDSPCAVGTVESRDWPLPNVWLGVSVEDQKTADERIPILLDTPAAVRFVSVEPMLGPVDFKRVKTACGAWATGCCCSAPACMHTKLDWVIVGGESGPGARPCDVALIRGIVRQCRESGTAVFVKQLGRFIGAFNDQIADVWPNDTQTSASASYQGADVRVFLRDRKGGDPSEWPEALRVREFPTTAMVTP